LDNDFRVLFEAKWQAAALRGSDGLPKPFWETWKRGCQPPRARRLKTHALLPSSGPLRVGTRALRCFGQHVPQAMYFA
jgi:hypothetical protein